MTNLFSLADLSLAALSNPKRGLSMTSKDNLAVIKFPNHELRAKAQAKKLYKRLRRAVRFVVDDDLLHYVTDLSLKMDANQAYNMLRNSGRLPFPDVWFEWDEKKRVQQINEWAGHKDRSLEHIPERTGYLAKEGWPNNTKEQLSEDSPCCFFTNFFHDNGYVCIPPTGIQMNLTDSLCCFPKKTKDDLLPSELGKSFAIDDLIDGVILDPHNEQSVQAAMLAGWWVKKNENKRSLPKLMNSIRLVSTDALAWWRYKIDYVDQEVQEALMEFSKACLHGDARFMIALLATINYTRFVNEPEEQKFVGRRIRFGKVVSGSTYRVLKLTLPKPMGVNVAARKFSENPTKRRLHEVIGHYVHKRNGTRYWRNAHSRGNKEFGKVIKDYELAGR